MSARFPPFPSVTWARRGLTASHRVLGVPAAWFSPSPALWGAPEAGSPVVRPSGLHSSWAWRRAGSWSGAQSFFFFSKHGIRSRKVLGTCLVTAVVSGRGHGKPPLYPGANATSCEAELGLSAASSGRSWQVAASARVPVAGGPLRAGGRRSELGSLRGTERDLRECGEMGGKHRCIGGLPTARSPPRPRPRSAEGGSCAFQSPRNAKLGTGKQRGEGCKAEVAEKGWGTGREISKFCIPED